MKSENVTDQVKLYGKIAVYSIAYIVLIPFLFIFGIGGLACILVSFVYIFPKTVYHMYKYKRVVSRSQRPDDMQYLEALISFYKHNPTRCSDLVKKSVLYLDRIFRGYPQQQIENRYNVAVFLGKLCVEAERGRISNNDDVLYEIEETFKPCTDPRNCFKKLELNDVKLFIDWC